MHIWVGYSSISELTEQTEHGDSDISYEVNSFLSYLCI
jgi:hypothetical protein